MHTKGFLRIFLRRFSSPPSPPPPPLCPSNDGDVVPIVDAAERGDVSLVHGLIRMHGVDVNSSRRDGTTALHEAASGNHVDVVKLLLECGAYMERHAQGTVTPLWIASQENALASAQLLLDAKADVSARHENASCLYIASQMGHVDMIAKLIDHGANPSDGSLHAALHEEHTQVAHYLVERGADVNMVFEDGATPLWIASAKGLASVVELLLQRNATLGHTVHNISALEIASKRHHDDVVSLLKQKLSSSSSHD